MKKSFNVGDKVYLRRPCFDAYDNCYDQWATIVQFGDGYHDARILLHKINIEVYVTSTALFHSKEEAIYSLINEMILEQTQNIAQLLKELDQH